MTSGVVIYRTRFCPYCGMATRLLDSHQVPYSEVDVTGDGERRRWLLGVTGQRTVPQIFINGRPIGGFMELAALVRRGELEQWLAKPPVARGSADPACSD